MTWKDAAKKEYYDYNEAIKRMEEQTKTKQYKELKEYMTNNKKRRLDYAKRELHSKD